MAQIDKLFYLLKERKGSDLHISVGAPPLIRRAGEIGATRWAHTVFSRGRRSAQRETNARAWGYNSVGYGSVGKAGRAEA